MLATINITPAERAAGAPEPETLAQAVRALRAQGCVLLRGAIAPELVAAMRETHFARNAALLQAAPPSGAYQVGNRRFMSEVELAGPFAATEVYANPFVLPVLRTVIAENIILGTCTTVTSLPGAKTQHVHRDGPPLFHAALNRLMPAHAVNLLVPMIDFNASTGTTRLYPGSHLDAECNPETAPFVDPEIAVGTVLLMDYRLFHRGLANQSDRVRPLFVAVYQRPWFKDYKNHESVPFFRLSDEEHAKVPAEHRRLFAWIEHYRAGLY